MYISGTSPAAYTIFFGNEPTATAPAQRVVVTNTVDPTKFNLSALTFGPITFPGVPGVVPPAVPAQGLGTFSTQVDLNPTINLFVNVTASLDISSGLLTWTLQSIDPSTGLPPADPSVGFLPPGGNGSVSFTVTTNPSLTTGTAVADEATVVFDTHGPISTPVWSNTIDITPPVSKVAGLPSTESTVSFPVAWSGTDVGSGIQSYTIYVSDSGAAYTAWLINTPSTSAKFIGTIDHTYSFYSVATDFAGNTEAAKTTPDTMTTITIPCAVNSTRSVTVARGGFRFDHATHEFVQTVTIQNVSSTALTGPVSLVLDSLPSNVTLSGLNGITACNVPLNSQFLNLAVGSAGTLAAGASETVNLNFSDPSQTAIMYATRVLTGSGVR